MLDLTNLIQTVPAATDSVTKLDLNAGADVELDVSAEAGDDKDSDIDPHSFILLLAEVASNIIVKNDQNTNENEAVINSDDPENKAQNISASSQLNEEPIESSQSDQRLLETNVALAWIDAESFEAPYSENIKAEEHPFIDEALEMALSSPELVVSEQEAAVATQKSTPAVLNETEEQNLKNKSVALGEKNSYTDTKEQNLSSGKTLLDESNFEILQNKLDQISLGKNSSAETVFSDISKNSSQNTSSLFDAQQNVPHGDPDTGTNVSINLQARQNNDGFTPISQPKSLEIPVSVENEQWADKFSEQIVWLGNQGIKSALIKIHPEDLGPLEISVKVVNDSASVNITSHSLHARDIVDQALPRLRDMMTEQGLNLTEVHVGVDGDSRQYRQQDNQFNDEVVMESSGESVQTTPLQRKQSSGLIDYFA